MGEYTGNERFDTSTVTDAAGMHSNAGADIYQQGKKITVKK